MTVVAICLVSLKKLRQIIWLLPNPEAGYVFVFVCSSRIY